MPRSRVRVSPAAHRTNASESCDGPEAFLMRSDQQTARRVISSALCFFGGPASVTSIGRAPVGWARRRVGRLLRHARRPLSCGSAH